MHYRIVLRITNSGKIQNTILIFDKVSTVLVYGHTTLMKSDRSKNKRVAVAHERSIVILVQYCFTGMGQKHFSCD